MSTIRAACVQFAARPQDASIIHFGGRWSFGLDGQQKLVRGRNEDLALRLGTPGLGPGTFAFVLYPSTIPNDVYPEAVISFPATKPGQDPIKRQYTLTQRC